MSSSNWIAQFEGPILHISGVERYPDQFSTAGLERLAQEEPGVLCYRLAFYRDKEPFCDLDGVGPVHHYEHSVPDGTKKIRVYVDDSAIDFPIRRKR